MPRQQIIVYSHTHWDRAWYAPFEVFRHKLVEHLDEVIEHLEQHPEFLHYTVDGQTAILDDYLEIRPHMRDRIRTLALQGRLEIGPWYVQPDCFIPSGESLIRNLLCGRELGLELGQWATVGYLPDSFGFPSQLPSILSGFGIDSMVFSRGMSSFADRSGCEFIWYGAGSARVLGLWMPQGYGHGCNLGYVTWWGDPRRQDFHPEHGFARLQDNLTKHQAYSRSGVTVVPNGVDHSPIEAGVPQVIAAASGDPQFAGIAISHGTLRSYVDAVIASGAQFDTYRGEFRSSDKGVSLQGVHSARLYLKQQNHRAEIMLERWAEPLLAMDACFGSHRDRRALLHHAWKLLLQNHPHDDICGCSVDAVHRENETRSLSVTEVASALRREAAVTLGHAMDFSSRPGIPLVVYNPHGFPVREIIEIDCFLQKHELQGSDVILRDHRGEVVASGVISRHQHTETWVRGISFNRIRYRVQLAADLPPCGWATYYLESVTAAATSPPAPVASGHGSMENEHYRLDFHANGSFDLTVKATRLVHRGLHQFEDVGDRGDEYDHCPLDQPGLVTSLSQVASIAIERSAWSSSATITVTMELPIGLSPERTARARERAQLALRTTITLHAGSRRILCSTSGTNPCRDHRLRVRFPSGLGGDHHWVEEAFTVLQRLDRVQAIPSTLAPTPTAHQKSFVSLDDGKNGLSLCNRGLTEYEVLPDRTIALTLLRCVGFLSRGDLSTRPGPSGPELEADDAQCLRSFHCEYAVIAHAGDWRTAEVWKQAQLFTAPPWSFRGDEMLETDSRHFDDPALSARIVFTPPPRGGSVPDRLALIEVDGGGMAVSALKPAQHSGGIILRLYALGLTSVVVGLRFGLPVKRVQRVTLAEIPVGELTITANRVETQVEAGDLLSVLITF